MAKQTVPDLKELFKQAAEIAKQVPEAMQAAAFNRAVDLLSGTTTLAPQQAPLKQPKVYSSARSSYPKKSEAAAGPLNQLLENIDSTKHPGVGSSATVLDRALMILQIARNEHDVDGLTPSTIARLLTEKFRVNTSAAAVRMALGSSTNLVNRVPRGQAFVYRIMGPGEKHLAHITGDPGPAVGSAMSQKHKRHRSRKKGKAPSKTLDAGRGERKTGRVGKARTKAGSKKSTGSLRPKAALLSLVESGFFAAPKTAPDVQDHLKKKRGFDIGTPQLMLAMLRLVRDGILERDENSQGKYEYKRP